MCGSIVLHSSSMSCYGLLRYKTSSSAAVKCQILLLTVFSQLFSGEILFLDLCFPVLYKFIYFRSLLKGISKEQTICVYRDKSRLEFWNYMSWS